jgi:hypothetical protein
MLTDETKEAAVQLLVLRFELEPTFRERLMRSLSALHAESISDLPRDEITEALAEMFYAGLVGFKAMTDKGLADYLVTEYSDSYEGDLDRDDLTYGPSGLALYVIRLAGGE